jgi:apolipoprotein D and lipocalin family protein
MREQRRASGMATGLLCFVLAGASTLRAQGVTAVQQFDAVRYTGTWYEIAHYPNKHEKNCTRDVVHVVAAGDKPHSVQFVNACMTKRGYADASNVNARPQNKSGDGQLKIPTFWPFTRKYWIFAIGPEYDWSLTGNPNHKELWIFSRKTTLDPETLKTIEAKADAMGFSSAKLAMIQQTPR